MNISAPFIVRPVATVLLAIAAVLAGVLGFIKLPVAPLPQVDFPTISVRASLAGASPETMASSVATPLERSLGSIAGLNEMTSRSSQGSTNITLQFDLSRDINGAARDVQGAINAARSMLPSALRSNPTYSKRNPTSAPILILALTSKTMDQGQLYDVGSTILAQRIAQIKGVSEVNVGGSSLPAVRVELNPHALNHYGIALDEVRTALSNANARGPKGVLENDTTSWQVATNDQLRKAQDYAALNVAYRDGAPVRLSDVARVEDSVEDLFNMGFFNSEPAILLVVSRQPDANIIETVDRILDALPQMRAMVPGDVSLTVAQDRTPSIRASLAEAEHTLIIAVVLVILVVLLFLRNLRAALIPSVAVPVSLVTTFAVMYLCGYSLNTMSLMALIVATGFVVDDAIVVLENISRHVEAGMSPLRAALVGSREVGFTVLTMSVSLIAVFIPILLMGDIVGRLFREFSVTLSVAILVSLVVSVTLTPMMCARMLRTRQEQARREPGRAARALESFFAGMTRGYGRVLQWVLRHSLLTLLVLLVVIGLNVYLYVQVPKGFFPQQDTGQMMGMVRADQGTSFQAMRPKLEYFRQVVLADPAVESIVGYSGGRGGSNTSFMMIQLKPLAERKVDVDAVMNRLRFKLGNVPGARMFLMPNQDIRIGARSSNSSYQYSLMASELDDLRTWMPRVQRAMAQLPELTDIDTDVEDKGRQISLQIDRETATRLGVDMSMIASVLNNSFSQRQVSVIYNALNQYRVVMEVDQRYAQNASALEQVSVITANGGRVPLSAFAKWTTTNAPLSVSHQSQFAADTISFNLAPGVSLDQATRAIERAVAAISLPTNEIQAGFAGSAQALKSSLNAQPWLIVAALVTMYLVLGMLYESYIHPLTILSTLPSAGLGALLALMMLGHEFSLIALIGVFLLIGIVKKNAIMMVDFALDAERRRGLAPREAIHEACLMRFRPILMTTMAAMLGAVPLVISTGTGAELRQPLGITIVGGLLVSQLLTLFTTPVVYLYLNRLHLKVQWRWGRNKQAALALPGDNL
ncbi:Multidrug resistance protein MdtC [Pigmentiphaga humi]|uniref:Multidrug resistance protein MdtC n=1 Tax=Pigmentiphaga humi TaxID=2478468 RepID=A0A3P4B3P5_9BURK|nr:multidrug efflux RND transporter permease subunit [Pigmentiphaga humi]VCU70541.1 Multidrug resistance protein MdtC [Pigmentiphaga humi]